MSPTTAPRFTWVFQLLAVAIIGQTLFFKLSGAPETIALFEVLEAEPFGRYATAIAELVVVALLLAPRTAALGGLAAVGVMTGAIFSHLAVLGVSIDAQALGRADLMPLEGPSLFAMAVVAWAAGAATAWLRRRDLPVIGARFAAERAA